jgi:hypothetical protein
MDLKPYPTYVDLWTMKGRHEFAGAGNGGEESRWSRAAGGGRDEIATSAFGGLAMTRSAGVGRRAAEHGVTRLNKDDFDGR